MQLEWISGGTKIDIGLVDETGHILQHKRVETPVAEGAKAIENLILDSIRTLQKEAPFPLLGIGIGVAGQIDRESGDVIFAPNLKWHHTGSSQEKFGGSFGASCPDH